MDNPVSWFEIATADLERAKQFYATVFEVEFHLVEMPDAKMLMFPGGDQQKGAMGALISAQDNTPSENGTIIYFEVGDVAVQAGRVEAAGGKIVFPKMSLGEFGFAAQFIDTEGNRIGLHSHQ